MAVSVVVISFQRVYFAFGVVKICHNSLEVVAVVGLRTRSFAGFKPLHCLHTQGSRLDTSGVIHNNFEIHGKFQISLEYGRIFCPAICNNGVKFVCDLFFHFIVCGSSGREILLSGVSPWRKRCKTLV
jgi:hypothetical protein